MTRLVYFLVILSSLFSVRILSADDANLIRNSANDPDIAKNFPVIEFSLDQRKATPHYLELRSTEMKIGTLSCPNIISHVHTPKKAAAGTTFKFKSYIVAHTLFEAELQRGKGVKGPFYQGTDHPQIEDILKSFRSKDDKDFLKIMVKLSERRRGFETPEELKTLVQSLSGSTNLTPEKLKLLCEEFKTQLFFGTGYIEVEEMNEGRDSDLKKFIPISDVLNGNVKIDLKNAQVQVLKSTVLYLMDREFPFITDQASLSKKQALEKEMNEMMTSCSAQNCLINPDTFTNTLSTILKVGVVDSTKSVDVMDDDYDKKISALQLIKIEKIRDEFRKVCPK